MNTIVCVKSVPDSTQMDFDSTTGSLGRNGAGAVINPCDSVALEAALQWRERSPGTVTAVSMGPHSAQSGLRTALSMGADDAFLLESKAFAGGDVPATAYVLARFLKSLHSWNIVFCGKYSWDGDTGQVGSWLAELLNIPHASGIIALLSMQNGCVLVQQQLYNQIRTLSIPLPCLLVIEPDMYVPRTPSLAQTIRSRKQCITALDQNGIPHLNPQRCGLLGSATRVKGIAVPKRKRSTTVLDVDNLESLIPVLKERMEQS